MASSSTVMAASRCQSRQEIVPQSQTLQSDSFLLVNKKPSWRWNNIFKEGERLYSGNAQGSENERYGAIRSKHHCQADDRPNQHFFAFFNLAGITQRYHPEDAAVDESDQSQNAGQAEAGRNDPVD